MEKSLNKLIKSKKWKEARTLILSMLKAKSNDHWLLTRLSLTYYEEHNYKEALQISKKALRSEPECPLVLWDLAGALAMLGREKEAIDIYRGLSRRGVNSIANGKCGEGLAWARGLVADSYYRISLCYRSLGNEKLAQAYLKRHLNARGRGCYSIYPLKEVRRKVA